MNAVVMPAATEMTSLSGVTTALISSSSAPISCGLTVMTRVWASAGGLRGRHCLDTVSSPELVGPLDAARRRYDAGGRDDARAQQSRRQRLAHPAGAQYGDHGGSLPSRPEAPS